MEAVPLAVLGTLLICGGSFFAIVAPGDGQTGMFTFPLWGLGAWAGIAALIKARSASDGSMRIVGCLALIALASVAWSFYASVKYTHDRELRQRPSESDDYSDEIVG